MMMVTIMMMKTNKASVQLSRSIIYFCLSLAVLGKSLKISI